MTQLVSEKRHPPPMKPSPVKGEKGGKERGERRRERRGEGKRRVNNWEEKRRGERKRGRETTRRAVREHRGRKDVGGNKENIDKRWAWEEGTKRRIKEKKRISGRENIE